VLLTGSGGLTMKIGHWFTNATSKCLRPLSDNNICFIIVHGEQLSSFNQAENTKIHDKVHNSLTKHK
jgi:hypothetical protein